MGVAAGARGRLGGAGGPSRADAASRTGLWALAASCGGGAGRLARGLRCSPARATSSLKSLSEPGQREDGLGFAFAVAGRRARWRRCSRARVLLYGAFWALALGFALWFNWSHWVDLSHHWTQRDLFWRYYAQRKPGEPIAAYMMNWRARPSTRATR